MCFLGVQSSYLLEDRADCCFFIVLLLSCGCQCSMSLPHIEIGWSVVCDSGIS